MTALIRQFAIVLALLAVMPWPQACFAGNIHHQNSSIAHNSAPGSGLKGWGAAYAAAESQRQVTQARLQSQGLVAPSDESGEPAPRISDRQATVEAALFVASFVVPGLGLLLWLADSE